MVVGPQLIICVTTDDLGEKKLNREALIKYKTIFMVVRKILNEWDPVNLLPEAPEDEYELEVSKVLVVLNKAETIDELAEGITLIFNKEFDLNFLKEDCIYVAQSIWENTKK